MVVVRGMIAGDFVNIALIAIRCVRKSLNVKIPLLYLLRCNAADDHKICDQRRKINNESYSPVNNQLS